MKTSEALQAAPLSIQELVLSNYGYEVTGNKHVDCPFCNQKKKFRIGLWKKIGSYQGSCVCGSFTLMKLAEHRSGKTGKAFLDEIDELIGNTDRDFKPKPNKKLDDHLSVFRSGTDIKGTEAQDYLISRGITIRPRQNIRYCQAAPYDASARLPAIATMLTDELGRPQKIHYTYLKDGAKAPVEMPRKLFSLTEMSPSMCADIWQAAEVEAIGEGLESCFSFSMLRRIPCRPTLNTALMKNYRFGHWVKHGYIAMDNDHNAAGLAAASHCAHINILRCPNLEKVTILFPMTMGYDFNDALMYGDDIGELQVCRKPK